MHGRKGVGKEEEQLNARGEAGSERRNGYCKGAAPVKFRIQSMCRQAGFGTGRELASCPHGGMVYVHACLPAQVEQERGPPFLCQEEGTASLCLHAFTLY